MPTYEQRRILGLVRIIHADKSFARYKQRDVFHSSWNTCDNQRVVSMTEKSSDAPAQFEPAPERPSVIAGSPSPAPTSRRRIDRRANSNVT